ncbi:MAG: YihY/virulence factor BrkB family protein [Pseudomonadota bacterium]|nr:YihY/virulence factor BrkB family protein [Pseudomonadota bacterium]
MSKIFKTAKHTILLAASGFSDDELMTRAAALAFYSALSFAPLLVLLIWGLSLLHSGWDQRLIDTLTGMLGSRAAEAVKNVMDNAKARPHVGNIAGLIGLVVTLIGASAVFAQLQGTLNRVWGVQSKPGALVGAWLRSRAHALALVVGVAFLLVISFLLSGLIKLLVSGDTLALSIIEDVVSAAVFVLVFGAMYKVLPDAIIEWSDALVGALLTAILFIGGKFLIGLYIDHSKVGGAYGPAGAIIVLLTWVYYSSIIVLMGAELTRGLADARGKPIRPSAHAVEIPSAQTRERDWTPNQPGVRKDD